MTETEREPKQNCRANQRWGNSEREMVREGERGREREREGEREKEKERNNWKKEKALFSGQKRRQSYQSKGSTCVKLLVGKVQHMETVQQATSVL